MKVKELIERLQQEDPETDVVVGLWDQNEDSPQTIIELEPNVKSVQVDWRFPNRRAVVIGNIY